MKKYELLATDGRARRGRFTTPHGVIETPVFMNVGTVAAIKGAVSTMDLHDIHTQVELSNTYHLHVRPGDDVIKKLGGLHKFMNWDKPILTDSGGFQVFSLAGLRKIKEEGVHFNSHIDGRKIFMGPEESMQIQSNLASTIAMAFDECPPHPATREYMQNSVDRTTRWLRRCKAEMERLNALPDTINKEQMLFGIDQGGTFEDIRINHARAIRELDLDGYAIGGLAVGETHEQMYHILDVTVPELPQDKPIFRRFGIFRYCISSSKSSSVISRITLQGEPAAITPAGISFVTTLPAPITLPSPIETPPTTVTLAPSHTFSPSVIGALVNMRFL